MATFGPGPRSAVMRGIAASLIAASVVAVAAYGIERVALRARRDRATTVTGPVPPYDPWRKFESKGVVRPAVVEASRSGLRPGDAVIGVEAGGKARAYRVDAMRTPDRHIINDVVGGVPVSVAYCDLSDCVRAYTDPGGDAPLDVALVGLHDREMVVKIKGELYYHRTSAPMTPGAAALPYATLTPTRTTWGEWLRLHPGTDVDDGGPGTGP